MSAGRNKTPPRYHHGNLRSAFLEEGRRILEEIGVQELGMRDLARRVGVSEAAYSRHFSGKEALLAAIAAEGFRELACRRIAVADSAHDGLTKTHLMMRVYVEFARQNKGLFNLMIGPRLLSRQGFPEIAQESARSFKLFSNSVEELALQHGWNESSLPRVVHSAWVVEHGLAMLIISDRLPRSDMPIDIEEVMMTSFSLFLNAVTSGPAGNEKLRAQISLVVPIDP